MKTLITTLALIAAASTASAYTCSNTVETVNGKIVYTASQCGNQTPASNEQLSTMSDRANNPDLDENKPVVVRVKPKKPFVIHKQPVKDFYTGEVIGYSYNTADGGFTIDYTEAYLSK
jgi:hypothetical protein